LPYVWHDFDYAVKHLCKKGS